MLQFYLDVAFSSYWSTYNEGSVKTWAYLESLSVCCDPQYKLNIVPKQNTCEITW